jgi:hypothetical protein
MPQKPLDYRTVFAEAANSKAGRAGGVVAAGMLVVNLALVCRVLVKPDSGFAVAMFGVPLVNLSLVLVSLAFTPLVSKYMGRGSLRVHVMVSIAVPIVLAIADVIVFRRLVFPNGVSH